MAKRKAPDSVKPSEKIEGTENTPNKKSISEKNKKRKKGGGGGGKAQKLIAEKIKVENENENGEVAAAAEEVEEVGGKIGNVGGEKLGGEDVGAKCDFKNKEKVLILCSRGTGARFRHLMLDMIQLLPHCKKDAKIDGKTDRDLINEMADIKGCSSVMFFETRKRRDLYLWLAKSPEGPSAKFLVQNIHTMSELRLSGNHLKGSRPVLSFDKNFDGELHWKLLKEVLKQIFVTPHRNHKSKPFFDHIMSFSVVDGRIWIRNYQVVGEYERTKVKVDDTTLVEVGPRCCLQPIKIFEGSFKGKTLFHNPDYVSPNHIRTALKRRDAEKYHRKMEKTEDYKKRMAENQIPHDDLKDVFK